MNDANPSEIELTPPRDVSMWVQNPTDPNLVRYWDGSKWTGNYKSIEFAGLRVQSQSLGELQQMKADLRTLRFRVGFLALVVLIQIVIGGYLIFSWANSISQLNF